MEKFKIFYCTNKNQIMRKSLCEEPLFSTEQCNKTASKTDADYFNMDD